MTQATAYIPASPSPRASPSIVIATTSLCVSSAPNRPIANNIKTKTIEFTFILLFNIQYQVKKELPVSSGWAVRGAPQNQMKHFYTIVKET